MDRRSREEYNGLPPDDWEWPTRAQEKLEESAGSAAFELSKCALYPENPWFMISYSCGVIEELARKRGPERLTPRERDRVLNGIIEARCALVPAASEQVSQILNVGFDALFVLANHLAETDDQRAARHPHLMLDALAYARILRDCARCQLRAEEVLDRATQRRAAVVESIIADALVHVPQFLPRKVA